MISLLHQKIPARFFIFPIILLAILFVMEISNPQETNAQLSISASTGMSLNVTPEYPGPEENVEIIAESYTFSINSSEITWSINGKVVQKGIGIKSIKTQAPKSGESKDINVTAITSTGQKFYQATKIKPVSIDMIIESDGYVPPLFNGRISPSYQNTIKITAIPHLTDANGREYDPKTLLYQWKKDSGVVLQNESGYGKQSIFVAGSLIPRPSSYTVEVYNKDGTAKGRGIVSVIPQPTDLVFYKNDQLYGTLFNIAEENIIRIGSQRELGILAVPFGFNIDNSNLEFTWMINGYKKDSLSNSRSVILRSPDSGSGTSYVDLQIQNREMILQSAKKGFSAIFSESASAESQAREQAVF